MAEPILIMFLLLLCAASSWVSYRNGVNDGAGAIFEPTNPGYYVARQWLKRNNMKQWNLDLFKSEGD